MTVRIEVVDLGRGAHAAGLLAEFDAEDDTIRVSATAFERVRASLGAAEARRFVACAVAHERHHRSHPGASEDEAHAAARRACGVDPRHYEAALRDPRA